MSAPTLSISIPPSSPPADSSDRSIDPILGPSLPSASPSSASTTSEIERELSSVRFLRRRSASLGGNDTQFDPDIPIAMTPVQSALESADGIHPTHPASVDGSDESQEDTLSSLWVPATLHPELAPGEFRAFLKEHAHAHAQQSEASSSSSSPGLSNSLSASRSAPSVTPSSPFDSSSLKASNSGSLGRKRSMLSRQYTPRAGDGVENEPPLPGNLHRSRSNRTSIYSTSQGTDVESGVTLVDLQMLEELADEAAKSDDPSKLRSMLKRSWSINSQKSSIDSIDGVAFDENDAPIVALRPGAPSLMRRTARTKIRKAGMEGGENRFGPSRKGRTAHLVGDNALTFDDDNLPGPIPISLDDPPRMPAASSEAASDENQTASSERPISTASSLDDTFYDAYLDASRLSLTSESSASYESVSRVDSPSPPSQPHPNLPSLKIDLAESSFDDEPTTPTQQNVSSFTADADAPPIPSSTSDSSIVIVPEQRSPAPLPPRTPSPIETPTPQPHRVPSPDPSIASTTSTQRSSDRPAHVERVSSPAPSLSTPQYSGSAGGLKMERTDSSTSSIGSSSGATKEKKGGLFSRHKGDKKDKKDKDKSKSGSSEKEKPSVFGSLFGSKKKDKDDKPSQVTTDQGRLVATALLGKTAKSPVKNDFGTGPSSSTTSGPFSNFARYPIHVERAVYRLSHIKLANPRRPLYEQVLISNLMFWYLSVINRTQNGPAGVKEKEKADKEKAEKEAAQATAVEKADGGKPKAGEDAEIAGAEKAHSLAGKGTPPGNSRPNPYLDGTAAAAAASVTPPAQKRTSLTREDPRGAGRSGNGRSAESLAVRTPQYGAQNLQIEKERMMPGGEGPPPPRGGGGGEHRERESRPPPPANLVREQRPNPPPQQQQQQQQPQLQPQSGYGNARPPPQQQPHRVVSAGRDPDRRRSPPPPQSMYGPNFSGAGPPPPLPTSHSHGPHDTRSHSSSTGGPARSLSPNPPFPSSQSHPQPHVPSISASSSAGPNSRRSASDHVSGPPHPHQQQQQQLPHPPHPSGAQAMRKGSSESGVSRGPQPGQVFAHPNGAMPGQVFRHPGGASGPPGAVRPGEVFNPSLVPQLGQVFQHPGYRPPPQQMQQRPGMPPGPPSHPSQQQQQHHLQHPQQQQRLPPGLSPQQLQQYYAQHPHLQPSPYPHPHPQGGPPFPSQQQQQQRIPSSHPPPLSSRPPHDPRDPRKGGPPPPQQGYPPQGYRPQPPNGQQQQYHPDPRQQVPRSRSGEGSGGY